jgi:hypothetical protein
MQEVTITFQSTINEMLVYFNLTSNYIIYDVGATSVVMKISSNRKMTVTNTD